jgi:hypothetical protein
VLALPPGCCKRLPTASSVERLNEEIRVVVEEVNDDYAFLITDDAAVAQEFGMIPREEDA